MPHTHSAPADGAPTDEQLWEWFVQGDDDALGVLEARYRAELHWYLLLSMGKQDGVARALKSVWTLLASYRQGFQGFPSLRTWLYAVVTQNCVPATRPDPFGLTDLVDDLRRGPQRTRREELFYRIVDMSREVRQPFLLTVLAGLSIEDAARACNFDIRRTWRCLERAYERLERGALFRGEGAR